MLTLHNLEDMNILRIIGYLCYVVAIILIVVIISGNASAGAFITPGILALLGSFLLILTKNSRLAQKSTMKKEARETKSEGNFLFLAAQAYNEFNDSELAQKYLNRALDISDSGQSDYTLTNWANSLNSLLPFLKAHNKLDEYLNTMEGLAATNEDYLTIANAVKDSMQDEDRERIYLAKAEKGAVSTTDYIYLAQYMNSNSDNREAVRNYIVKGSEIAVDVDDYQECVYAYTELLNENSDSKTLCDKAKDIAKTYSDWLKLAYSYDHAGDQSMIKYCLEQAELSFVEGVDTADYLTEAKETLLN